jgi:DNA topoisomerase-1
LNNPNDSMPKSLVIVESPAKAKTINKYLGADFVVEASIGHVKDLPKGGLAIDVESGFVPTYEIIHGKEDVVRRLQNLAGRCDRIYLATDPDREGEAIAHHIAEEIRGANRNIRRVLFNEITKNGVATAMRSPRDIDLPMVRAQEARRVMDRLIGYKVSPFLWRTFTAEGKGLSAGRVQSVALRLVVERELAINSFVPIEYWNLLGHFRTAKGEEIVARLVRHDGRDLKNPSGSLTERKDADAPKEFISTRAEAEALRDRVLRESYRIASIGTKEVRRAAPPAFTTSTLQQEASRRLKMPTKRTMSVAQKLYEGLDLGPRGRVGLITYMRTDSVRVSEEAALAAEQYIYENYGKEYLGAPPAREPKQKGKNVQDAHEAIRPTDLKITPKEARKHLDKESADLYELIWSRFVASRMAPALFDQTTVEIAGGEFLFRATGRVTRFRGWMQVYEDAEEETPKKGRAGSSEEEGEFDRALPEGLRKGGKLDLESVETRQSFTKPPLRYTESTLIKELESKGIGRPSTYASIISTIQERAYVEQRERKLHATELGIKVSNALVGSFPALFDVKFTARMEGELDTIARGEAEYLEVMRRFYRPFESSLKGAGVQLTRGAAPEKKLAGTRARDGENALPAAQVAVRTACPKCTSPMVLRAGKYGPYLACTAFPKCRQTMPANPDGSPRFEKKEPAAAPVPVEGEVCARCGSPMMRRRGKSGEFLGCSAYPRCAFTKPIPLDLACPLCREGKLVQRAGGRYNSTFYGCTRYPECRFTSSLKPVDRKCARCGNAWLAEAWSQDEGTFIECPRCKNRPG